MTQIHGVKMVLVFEITIHVIRPYYKKKLLHYLVKHIKVLCACCSRWILHVCVWHSEHFHQHRIHARIRRPYLLVPKNPRHL